MTRSCASTLFALSGAFLFCFPVITGAQQSISEGPQEELFEAAKAGDIRGVSQALAAGADINAKDNEGYTALMEAGDNNHADIAKLLLERGANPNVECALGLTALMGAAMNNGSEVVDLLLGHGAEINARSKYGSTALMYAAFSNASAAAKALLERGAEIHETDNSGKTALDYANTSQMQELLRLYLSPRGVEEENLGDDSAKGGLPREALQHYISAIQVLPIDLIDVTLRKKIIALVLQLNPPPAIPEDAIRHASYAEAAVEEAQKDANPSHLNDAVSETEKALRVAPWWAQGYFSLAALLEKTNQPGDAANALQFYLLADPHAVIAQKNGMNAQDVQVKIYKLQYEAKQAQGNSQ